MSHTLTVGTSSDATAEGGLVRLTSYSSYANQTIIMFLSPEEARALASDLKDRAAVAELEESEARAERLGDVAELESGE
jgi:hypothetical protein